MRVFSRYCKFALVSAGILSLGCGLASAGSFNWACATGGIEGAIWASHPSGKPHVVAAAIIETPKGVFLVEDNYLLSKHVNLVQELTARYGPELYDYYGGELVVQDSVDGKSPPRILQINDTSSRRLASTGPKSDDPIGTALSILKHNGYQTDATDRVPWRKGYAHLDRKLEAYGHYARHKMGGDLNQLGLFAILFRDTHKFSLSRANGVRKVMPRLLACYGGMEKEGYVPPLDPREQAAINRFGDPANDPPSEDDVTTIEIAFNRMLIAQSTDRSTSIRIFPLSLPPGIGPH